jgi:hypothetical protein
VCDFAKNGVYLLYIWRDFEIAPILGLEFGDVPMRSSQWYVAQGNMHF